MGYGNKSGVTGVTKKHHGEVDGGEKVYVKTVGRWHKTHRKYHNVSPPFCSIASDPSAVHSTLACVSPNAQACDRCLWANVNFLLWIYCQWMMNALNITGYSSHIFSATAPSAEQRLMLTNRCHHCPPCPQRSHRRSGWQGEMPFPNYWGPQCGVTLHYCVTKVRKSFCVCLRAFKWVLCAQICEFCLLTLNMKGGDRWRTVSAQCHLTLVAHLCACVCVCTCVCLSLSWPWSCKRPTSIHKASALFLGLPGKCDVTCGMSKTERGGRLGGEGEKG